MQKQISQDFSTALDLKQVQKTRKKFKSSKQNSIESMGRNICEIYGFGQETSDIYWKLPLHKARVYMCIQELIHEYEQVMNTARTRNPRIDLC